MRCAIYARFSSDLQDARSITDQTALCRERAQREGWAVVAEYSDAAISGSSLHNRPGLLDLMVAAQNKQFDAVLAEDIDRLSRDLEDSAGLYKRLRSWGVKIITLADGEVGTMQVGLKGLMANMFLENLALKTRRGHIGRLKAGRVPGGKLYGYDVVKGEEKGLRTINEAEATIVRRIFAEYIAGRSPLDIVEGLNRDGIPAPFGGKWNASTINGSPKRENGIIMSRLYVGQIVYNRQRFVKDPATGKRKPVNNPRSEWIVQEAPELAIVDEATFHAVQERRMATARQHLHNRRRAKHLLSGLIRCGCCGGNMIIVTKSSFGCSDARSKRTCSNRKSIHIDKIESRVLSVLQKHLRSPEIVRASIEAYRIERAETAAKRAAASRQVEKELAALDMRIARLVRAIEDGESSRTVSGRLAELEAERDALVARVPPSTIDENVLQLHPTAARRYAEQVERISEALSRGDEAAQEAISLVRKLITSITVHPAQADGTMRMELRGDLAVMLDPIDQAEATISMVAGPRNHSLAALASASFAIYKVSVYRSPRGH